MSSSTSVSRRLLAHNRVFEEFQPPEPTLVQRVSKVFSGYTRVRLAVLRDVGILRWLPAYTRDKFWGDLAASAVIAVVLVPQGMAYALLAGLDPVYGLYSSTLPLIVYSFITTSSQVAPGPVAPTAILMEGMVREISRADPRTAEFTRWHITLAFVTGVFQILLGLLRFSWVADLLSWPVMSGFASGAAFIILISQVADLLGLKGVPRETSFFMRLYRVCAALPSINGPTVAISIISVLVLLYAKQVSVRGYKLPKMFPVPLFLMAIMTLVSYLANFQSWGVKIAGRIPAELPVPMLPLRAASDIERVAVSAALLAVINYVQTVSLAVLFGKRVGETVHSTAEMFALGCSSLVGSFFQCYTVAGSFTRTVIQYEAGARTPATILMTGLFIVVFILTVTRVLTYLPMCVLASIVVVAAKQLIGWRDARELWEAKKSDFLQLAVTFIAVLFLDIMYGLIVGVAFALGMVLYRCFSPRIAELGRLPGTDTFVAKDRFPVAQAVPGVAVLRLDGELHFGNVRVVTDKLYELLEQAKRAASERALLGPEAIAAHNDAAAAAAATASACEAEAGTSGGETAVGSGDSPLAVGGEDGEGTNSADESPVEGGAVHAASALGARHPSSSSGVSAGAGAPSYVIAGSAAAPSHATTTTAGRPPSGQGQGGGMGRHSASQAVITIHPDAEGGASSAVAAHGKARASPAAAAAQSGAAANGGGSNQSSLGRSSAVSFAGGASAGNGSERRKRLVYALSVATEDPKAHVRQRRQAAGASAAASGGTAASGAPLLLLAGPSDLSAAGSSAAGGGSGEAHGAGAAAASTGSGTAGEAAGGDGLGADDIGFRLEAASAVATTTLSATNADRRLSTGAGSSDESSVGGAAGARGPTHVRLEHDSHEGASSSAAAAAQRYAPGRGQGLQHGHGAGPRPPILDGAAAGSDGSSAAGGGGAGGLWTDPGAAPDTDTDYSSPYAVPLRAVVLDGSRVVDIDATACRELQQVMEAYSKAGFVPRPTLLFTALPGPVRDTLDAFGLDKAVDPATTRFLSIPAAVASLYERDEEEQDLWDEITRDTSIYQERGLAGGLGGVGQSLGLGHREQRSPMEQGQTSSGAAGGAGAVPSIAPPSGASAKGSMEEDTARGGLGSSGANGVTRRWAGGGGAAPLPPGTLAPPSGASHGSSPGASGGYGQHVRAYSSGVSSSPRLSGARGASSGGAAGGQTLSRVSYGTTAGGTADADGEEGGPGLKPGMPAAGSSGGSVVPFGV